MKATLLVSCVSVLIISSHSQFFLPKIQAGINTGVKKVEKVFSDIGLVPTTAPPPAHDSIENHHHHPSTNTLTPVQSTNIKTPIAAPAQPNNVKIDKKPAVNSPNVLNSNDKPVDGEPHHESGAKAGEGFIPGPGSLSDPKLAAPVKNNATSLSHDGTVVFPEDNHNPDAAVVNNTRACVAGQTYPANHPCGKGYDAKVVCVDGTSLDENNECRPSV